MHQIEVSDCTIDVVRKKIKNMHLSVYPPTGRVRIAVPLNINDDAVKLFAISKLAWIKRNQRKFDSQERQSPRVFQERESHYFLGRRFLLRITEKQGPPRIELKTKTYIDMYVKPGATSKARQGVLNAWYRQELKKLIPPLIDKWEKIIAINLNDWGVKQMKTKWGTCNIEEKRIWLNLELAKKPVRCIEYIIVHEMIHLLVRHHNPAFEALLNQYLPKWKITRKELNDLPVSYN